ncbi:MAG TPA: hypothetical protein VNJ28_08480, partial [Candidatus Limnocylindrales bacterium]|nr:hypothetical protein [Candidatus Limnocylindrales bacterium]
MTGGRGPFVLGVDGGATKTLALVGGPDGRIRGAGRAGSSDIHRASDPSQALERIVGAVDQATRAAGVPAARLTGAVFSLCGADWPEDVELYRSGLRGRLGLAEPPVVVNDALGPLLAETPDGRGVSIVVGTGLAIGARGPGGPAGTSWHSGFWVEPSGASELGRDGLFALLRAELGAGPATAIRPRALAAFGVGSVEELLHLITRVGGLGELGLTRLGPVVLDAGHAGDPVAA